MNLDGISGYASGSAKGKERVGSKDTKNHSAYVCFLLSS